MYAIIFFYLTFFVFKLTKVYNQYIINKKEWKTVNKYINKYGHKYSYVVKGDNYNKPNEFAEMSGG